MHGENKFAAEDLPVSARKLETNPDCMQFLCGCALAILCHAAEMPLAAARRTWERRFHYV